MGRDNFPKHPNRIPKQIRNHQGKQATFDLRQIFFVAVILKKGYSRQHEKHGNGKPGDGNGEKVGFFDFNNMRIQERLQKSYIMVLAIATIAAVLGIVSVFVISTNYKKAMDNYALPQGDIGQLMESMSQCRSATRGIIGYESAQMRESLLAEHDEYKGYAEGWIETIKPTIVTSAAPLTFGTVSSIDLPDVVTSSIIITRSPSHNLLPKKLPLSAP